MKWKEFYTNVFLINLPEMTERFSRSANELFLNGIEFTKWVATKKEDGVHGLLASMKSLFEYILTTDITNFIVLEDDFHFLLDPNPYLDLLVEQLPEDYHCLFLGCNLLSRPTKYSDNLLLIGSSYSTHAIGYNRRAVELILPLFNHPVAYDIMLMQDLQPLGKCYTCNPRLATQHAGYSSIEKREIDWEAYMAQTFTMHTKGV